MAAALLAAACGGAAQPVPSTRPAAPGARLADVSATTDSTALVVALQVEGLPPHAAVTVVATADATARYACGAFLSEPVSAQAGGLARTHAGADGTAAVVIRVRPPPPSGIECARGAAPTSALYSNVTVADLTDRVQATVAGEFHGTA